MNRIRRIASALAVLPIALASLAGADGHERECRTVDPDPAVVDDEYELCEEQVWFHRAETPVGNLGSIPDVPHGLPSWDNHAPEQSVRAGAGGGFFSNAAVGVVTSEEEAAAVFEGTFDGIIDSLDVDLHVLFRGPATADTYWVELFIDGYPVVNVEQAPIVAVPQEGQNAAHRLDFAIAGLAGLVRSLPDADGTHTVRLEVEPWYIFNDAATVFVFDTTEVPGGMTFNPETIPADSVVIN